MDTTAYKLIAYDIRAVIEFKSAYAQCDPEIRQVIDEMMDICIDLKADEDEKNRAIATIIEAVFPNLATDLVEFEKRASPMPEAEALEKEMDEEEAFFADRLRYFMDKAGMTQEQLAEKTGVGQPAISNMLNRQCRPQHRTVRRFADALGVSPEELGPAFRSK